MPPLIPAAATFASFLHETRVRPCSLKKSSAWRVTDLEVDRPGVAVLVCDPGGELDVLHAPGIVDVELLDADRIQP